MPFRCCPYFFSGGREMDLGAILAKIEAAAVSALNEDVVKDAKEHFVASGQKVYAAYHTPEGKVPVVYDRKGRLLSESAYAVSGGGLQVTISSTHPYGQLIEYGHGVGGAYEYPYNQYGTAQEFLQPRPFFMPVVDYLSGGGFVDTLRAGLNARGIPAH